MANLPTRSNNPGDLRDPSTGSFRTFASPEAGYAALAADLHGKMTGATSTGLGPESTLQEFASTYAPASDGNDPIQYARNLASSMGVDPSAKIGGLSLPDFTHAVARAEGYQGDQPSMTVQDFASKIKAKYPAYQNIDDTELTKRIVTKYPQYAAVLGSNAPKITPYGEVEAPQTATPPPQADMGDQGTTDNGGFMGNVAKTAANIGGKLFPILPDIYNDIKGKNDKTLLQQVGDAGMTALWFLPFGDIAEGIGLGAEALGAGGALADAVGTIGAGLAGGYAGDVAGNLSAGKTDASVLKPGIGTATGGALSAAALGAGALYNKFLGQQSALDRVQGVWEDAAGATKSGINNMSKTASKGLQSNPEFLSSAGIVPEVEEQNGRMVFTTGEDSNAYQTIQKRISDLAELRDEALDKGPQLFKGTMDAAGLPPFRAQPPVVNFEDLRKQMLDQAGKDFSGTAMDSARDQINREMDALKADPKYAINENGDVTATQASKIKTYLQGRASLDRPTQGLSAQIFDTMQNTAKKSVEDAAEASGNPNVRAINKIMQQHYDALTFLKKINGQTVKGGRLGTYIKEGIGATIGAGAAGAMGGGPIGSVLGGLAGYKGGEIASRVMQKLAVGGPFTAGTIGRMASEDPEVVQQLLAYIGKDSSAAEKIAPMLKPSQSSSGGAVQSVLKRSPGSVFRGMSRAKAPATMFGTSR